MELLQKNGDCIMSLTLPFALLCPQLVNNVLVTTASGSLSDSTGRMEVKTMDAATWVQGQ